jgi:hypothetical protein
MVRALDLLDGWNGKVIKSWSSALIGFEELMISMMMLERGYMWIYLSFSAALTGIYTLSCPTPESFLSIGH